MTCAICRFYDVCIVRNTQEACTHDERLDTNHNVMPNI